MARSVVVIATSDKPALTRKKAAKTATAIAEYFRDQGKDVLLMMDSLTRFSMAQREIGLAAGEPPVSRGYPPSVYTEMTKLLERAGKSDKGSITGLYTVLVDGDDFNEPITDTARGVLDGHIILSRSLGAKGHYPAIDVLSSISRVMSSIVTKEHKKLAARLKMIMATYNESEDLINIGAYKAGANKNIDYAISKNADANSVLCGKIDVDNIAAAGHSQGGRSAVNAAALDSRIDCVLSIAGSSYKSEAKEVSCPVFFMTGTADLIVLSSMWVKPAYDNVQGNAVYASLKGGVHTTCMVTPSKVAGYGIVWFNAQLKGDDGAAAVFAPGGALASDSSWKNFACK